MCRCVGAQPGTAGLERIIDGGAPYYGYTSEWGENKATLLRLGGRRHR